MTPGIYTLTASAPGYGRLRSDDIVLAAGSSQTVRLVAGRVESGIESTQEIGRTTSTTRSAIQNTTVINNTVSADQIQRTGQLRVGQALLAQPGLTSFNLDSAPGDDLNISIRGMRPSEAQALIDGNPVGPIGLFNGNGGGYNYQLSPSFALKDVQINYGTGGGTLSGVDAIAGTIDFRTLDPTNRPGISLNYGIGTQGRQQTVIEATGTTGPFSYALVHGVSGTWGGFHNEYNAQSGLFGGDLTSANVAANTWLVTGNYNLRNDLIKLKYQIAPNTALTLNTFIATSWDDKTGEGDNDNYTAPYQTVNFNMTAGSTPGCAGVSVKTDNGPVCYNQQQFVNAFSGPAGGTPLAFQALHLQAYQARLTSSVGPITFAAEGYANKFYQYYDRNYGGFINEYWTIGERFSGDWVTSKNELGLGYFGVHQLYTPSTYNNATIGQNSTGALGSSVGTIFFRDQYDFNDKFTLYANLNYDKQSVVNQYSLNPRGSLVVHLTPADIFRVSYGQGYEAPAVSLLAQPVTITTQPGAVNPLCGGTPYSLGGAPNPGLKGEKATDLEIGYGHRFRGDSAVQIVAYDTEISNVIFSTVIGAPALGVAIPQPYLDRYNTLCNTNSATAANFGFTAAANAGAGRFRGINLSGRERVNHGLFFDYGYNVTSAIDYNIPTLSLQNNVLLIDGGQLSRVPYQQGNLSADYTFGHGTEFHIDGYIVGAHNALFRPSYTYANAYLSHQFGRVLLNLGASNVFNSQYDQYGRFGQAVFQAENQYGTDTDPATQGLTQGTERFGLPQQSFLLSATLKI